MPELEPVVLAPEVEEALYAAAILQEEMEQARKSPLGLYKLLFTDERGDPIVVKWFHEEWNEMIMNNRTAMIEASRGLTKTSFMLAAILWRIADNPNIRIKLICETEDNAKKRMAFLHDVIDNSRIFRQLFPHVKKAKRTDKAPNTTLALTLERTISTPEPTVEASGVLAAATGGRADLIVMDDVCGASNTVLNPSLKPVVRDKVLSDWLATLVSRGSVWCIFTPWASDDVNAHLKKVSGWAYKRYAHGKPGDPYHSIFPEIWPRDELLRRRRVYGPLIYAKAYLCQLIDDRDIIIHPAYLRPYTRHLLTTEKLLRSVAVVSADPASGKAPPTRRQRKTRDYTGIAVLLYVDNTHIPKVERQATGTPPFEIYIPTAFQTRPIATEQPVLLKDLAAEWGASYVLVESVGLQTLNIWLEKEQLQDQTFTAEIVPIAWGNMSKGQRLQKTVPLFAPPAGDPPIVYFHPQSVTPEPTEFSMTLSDGSKQEVMHTAREQLLGFPEAKNDDVMDAIVQGLLWIVHNLAPKPGSEEEEDGGEDYPGSDFVQLNMLEGAHPAYLATLGEHRDALRWIEEDVEQGLPDDFLSGRDEAHVPDGGHVITEYAGLGRARAAHVCLCQGAWHALEAQWAE